MPPKSAERLKQEAEAQRARVAALQYLAKTGGGPSQKEIAQQQKEREKWTNATSQSIQHKLAHLLPSAQGGHGAAPMRDNTLEAMAAQRARQMHQTHGIGDAAFRGAHSSLAVTTNGRRAATRMADGESSGLPPGWKQAKDPVSGETYYYNEVTKETSWDRPQEQADTAADAKHAAEDSDGDLEDGWEQVQDADSGSVYYWNRTTNATTWTKPVKQAAVSLEQAREAKSRLDAILKICGPTSQAKAPAKPAATSNQQARKQASPVTVAAALHGSNSKGSQASNDARKRGLHDEEKEEHEGQRVTKDDERLVHLIVSQREELPPMANLQQLHMMNTARVYSGLAAAAKPLGGNADPNRRPASVKKQKQQRKAQDSVAARQRELSELVAKLEDRDTQQQAFASLINLIPRLDVALVGDLYARIEKNKHPGRCSTRRLFVLVLAAVCKCHAHTSCRLLPRLVEYLVLRLRDKETQVTEACAIVCSAIMLYVVPHATVHINSKGCLSPRKTLSAQGIDDGDGHAATKSDAAFQTIESLVTTLSKETNAVGEHATKCIAALLRPVEFDGTTFPPAEAMAAHGQRLLPYLRVFFASLVAKMDHSTQYAGFSPSFVLLQAILALAKVLKLDCANAEAYNMVLPQVGSLVDSIEDVFRDGPRDDWLLRKRAVEVLIQLIDLFVLGATASPGDNAGQKFFDQNLERVRRLVLEARHDPVSAVRDAALPAAFQFEALLQLFPRTGEKPAPASPFKRVYTSRGGGSGIPARNVSVDRSQWRQRLAPTEAASDPYSLREETVHSGGDDDKEREEDFGKMDGDEGATPHDEPDEVEMVDTRPVEVPALKLTTVERRVQKTAKPDVVKALHRRKDSRTQVASAVPRIAVPKPLWVKPEVVPFQPLADDDIAFPVEYGDELDGHSSDSYHEENPPLRVTSNDKPPLVPARANGETKESTDIGDAPRQGTTAMPHSKGCRQTDHHQEDEEKEPAIEMSRAKAAVEAAAEGEIDLALRICFLEDDASLLKKVLAMADTPCVSALSRATRTALCATFLEFLDPVEDGLWLALAWLKDLSASRRCVQQLDPRVVRGLELRLNCLADMPSKAGLVAADILSKMGL